MTLTLLLKLLELAPTAIKELQGDITSVVAAEGDAAKVQAAIKVAEDALADLKALVG